MNRRFLKWAPMAVLGYRTLLIALIALLAGCGGVKWVIGVEDPAYSYPAYASLSPVLVYDHHHQRPCWRHHGCYDLPHYGHQHEHYGYHYHPSADNYEYYPHRRGTVRGWVPTPDGGVRWEIRKFK